MLILLLDHNTSWPKQVMEKRVLSDQTGFLSGQNLSLAGQMTCLLTKLFAGFHLVFFFSKTKLGNMRVQCAQVSLSCM